ncbi:helix-turn-helix transcriptional regulator [Actinoplanes couchii]|uniref:Transcriptional regulator n=1 Tax=Actinoplanes couchii TaxID=403638 RepID=A0ABQ3XHX3_9ACTN|nr:WYL domain-containing protein [Actinoplanes couchii]MDR6317701.1 putative DNA-binding transcriptional regulator YafY [Actinoplanes couchii]GID58086.1 transcriptional regulator [Actinoplanes couchii]
MRPDRLLALLLLLQARSPRSATELGAELEVSVRTIYRDAEALSAAGVPVYAERGRSGGIALLPGYRTQVPGLSPDEARALFVLTTDRPHADLGLGDALGSALRKVLASLPAGHRDTADLIGRRVLVDPARWGAVDDRPAHLDRVQAAVLDGRRLRIGYGSAGAGTGTYTLDPHGLVHKAGVWYLVAEHRRIMKTFRVDRVRDATVLDTPARRRSGFDLAATWSGLQDRYAAARTAVAVRVRVRRHVLPRVLRLHGDAQNREVPPGDSAWADLTLRFPVLDAAQALLAFGADVEVLEPAELRARLAGIGAGIAARYS